MMVGDGGAAEDMESSVTTGVQGALYHREALSLRGVHGADVVHCGLVVGAVFQGKLPQEGEGQSQAVHNRQ